MYYLKNEQECFIRFKATSGAARVALDLIKHSCEFFKWLQKRLHNKSNLNMKNLYIKIFI
jgi:hypothetical protein